MLTRSHYLNALSVATTRSPVTALLGPRQCGKTTLAKAFSTNQVSHYFDLEAPSDQQRLQNPELLLSSLDGLVVLDEIQLMPQLFSILRVLVDQSEHRARYLILGSASPQVIKGASETLAGRIEFIDLGGFDLLETASSAGQQLWLRGGFPRSFLAKNEADSLAWREGFIRTFLERDLPQLGINIQVTAMRRFWTMLAHTHGQIWNGSALGRSLSLSDKTVRHYLDILTSAYMLRQLQPWHANLKKRQVKSPKIYFRDTGLLHSLLGLETYHQLLGHPALGSSWEGFALEQVMRIVRPKDAYFWATHSGAEVDLFFVAGGRNYAIEFKFSEAPKMTRSMLSALESLELDYLWVIYPGGQSYPIHERIGVSPLNEAGLSAISEKIEKC